ncbi:NAD-dependent DNA ligase LigA [Mycoplasmopsis synoviae]|nr:NAD-dependent DNA ligase LigA [Mycoplasmopsis synoviae]AKB11291.1 hypothetical protein VY93_03130 [Mycoplasmopsis synoviae ATCC 25204]
MSNQQIKEKIISLNNYLKHLNHLYYDLDAPEVDDKTYDSLYSELLELEAKYPSLVLEDSVTKIIGAFVNNKFKKTKHNKEMLSLDKAYKKSEIFSFYENFTQYKNLENFGFSLEPKIDGLSISIHYDNGKFIKAITRGDGTTGEDVSENVFQIRDVPKQISYLKPLEVRGEIYMKKSTWKSLNEDIKNQYFQTNIEKIFSYMQALPKSKSWSNLKIKTPIFFKNARNAAAGTLRQKDAKIVKSRNLSSLFYEIVSPLEHNLKTQMEVLAFLKEQNFEVNEFQKLAKNDQEIMFEINEFSKIKNNFEFDCDGFVIKFNLIDKWEQIGFTSKFPKWAIAYKYMLEEANTKILNIVAQVGRTGNITYIAQFMPVELNNTTVQNATLHNYEFIKKNNINIGDEITIIKSGEIIPKVISIYKKNTDSVFEKVLNCPSCNSLLEIPEGYIDQFCRNENCDEKKIQMLTFFVSKNCLNITNLSVQNIRIFYNHPVIQMREIQDIFLLKNHIDEIKKIKFFAGKSQENKKINNILQSIEKAKDAYLRNVLAALGIKGIGNIAANLLTNKITKLSDLNNLTDEDLLSIDTFGEKSIENLKEFLSSEKNQDLIKFLDENLNYSNSKKSSKLNNLNFAITGSLSVSRDEFKKIILDNGGIFSNSVSKNTSYLISNSKENSTKIKKALENNIKVITEEEFHNLLKEENA